MVPNKSQQMRAQQNYEGEDEKLNWFDRIGRRFIARPAWFAVVVALALIMLPVAVWMDLKHLSNRSLELQASDLNTMISQIRSYYSRNVIARIKANGGIATPAHNYQNIEGGIPIPATLSIELGDVIGTRAKSVEYRFVSDKPFTGRSDHNLDDFERLSLLKLRETRKKSDTITKLSGSLFDSKIRMAVPVIMGRACVSCHNSHPDTPKSDWQVGDVRGIQSITLNQPIAANLLSFKYLLSYLLVAGLFAIVLVVLQWRQANRFVALNDELGEANSFLASVSMKISKYLSPQVYKSIFSGERDAVIATERKKLTIFFSDIKDFTATTESLQPEELTQLLNEYFTEMSKIAQQHGATLDKFIGDAILAFFGDPTTRGAKEDAKACLKMAIAMQERLIELADEWRDRGFEKPLRARMGINTGYCNVGNFGSDDRMDYTIIGAEANLAARLESIAKPGGIVMSYETYALVKDFVDAKEMTPISLKGISREIVPFKFTKRTLNKNLQRSEKQTENKAGIIESSTEAMKLYLQVGNITAHERQRAEELLRSALNALQAGEKT